MEPFLVLCFASAFASAISHSSNGGWQDCPEVQHLDTATSCAQAIDDDEIVLLSRPLSLPREAIARRRLPTGQPPTASPRLLYSSIAAFVQKGRSGVWIVLALVGVLACAALIWSCQRSKGGYEIFDDGRPSWQHESWVRLANPRDHLYYRDHIYYGRAPAAASALPARASSLPQLRAPTAASQRQPSSSESPPPSPQKKEIYIPGWI